MQRHAIRVEVLKGIAAAPAPFDEEVLNRLIERVVERNPVNITGYAFVVGRNWAIDTHRAAERLARQKLEETLEVERARIEAEQYESAVQEFKELRARLSLNASPMVLKQLAMVQLTVFERKHDPEAALFFPGTREARYQWKRRGLKLLWPHASENLRVALSRGAKHGRAL